MDKTERIKADAEAATNDHEVTLKAKGMEYAPMIMRLFGYKEGYITGATAEAANTQRAIDLMQEIINLSDRNQVAWNKAKEFIQQWKSGEKEERKACTCDNIQLAAHGECWGCPGKYTKEK